MRKKNQPKTIESKVDEPKVLCCVIARISTGDSYDRDDVLRETILPGMWEEMPISSFHKLQSAVSYANAKSNYNDPKYQVLVKAREEDIATALSNYDKFIETQQKAREHDELQRQKALAKRAATTLERKRKQFEKLQRELGATSE